MDEFPDSDEEYELLHREEMEAFREIENEYLLTQPGPSGQNPTSNIRPDEDDDDDDELNLVIDLPPDSGTTGKRQLSVESLNDLELGVQYIEPPRKRLRQETGGFKLNLHPGTTSLRFPKWPFVTFNTLNTVNGDRFYVKFRENEVERDLTGIYRDEAMTTGLLGDTYTNIKATAEKILNECNQRNTQVDDVVCETDENSDLWVEKYKPRSYFDLLSDEGVNRSLLNWLKMWDKVVFNKSKEKLNTNGQHRGKKPFNSNYKQFGKMSNSEHINEFDPYGRPHYKIALLCGPPGLGKTTLAHVIASHAGYNVMEVNASDDRSTEAFHAKLEAATKMQSVMGTKKPNCLVFDEIDGAPAASVEYLLKYLNSKTNQKGKDKDKAQPSVRRPVICICNDPYVPSLRQLRQQAYVVHFPHTSSSKLARRLLEICRKQNIKSDLSTLTLLCDKTQSDVRCCISTLHFFKTKNGNTFKPLDVDKCSVGQKDLKKSLFGLWQEVFHIPIKNNPTFTSPAEDHDDGSLAHFHYSQKNMQRLKYLVELFQCSGDLERLQQGVYENFLSMYFSQSASAVSSGMDWFCWSDILDTHIKENQNYSMLPYLPYSFAAWHFLFSSRGFAKVTFPKLGYENHLKEVRTNQILTNVLLGLNPGVRANTYSRQLVLDVLPMFKTILAPNLRPVDIKLFNEKEKKDLSRLIDIMIDYNLNYIQQRAPDGAYSFQLDPNIEEVAQLGETEQKKSTFSYMLRQIISREVEMEKARRTEVCESENEEMSDRPEVATSRHKVPYHLQTLTPKTAKIDSNNGAQYRDFFGRIVTVKPSAVKKGKLEKDTNYKSKLLYKYKEGYNNAVKKDINISYLL